MQRFPRSLLPTLLLLPPLLALPPAAGAHDLWLERDADGYRLYNGHRHSGHSGEEVIPYAPSFVQAVTCFDREGRPQAVEVERTYPARIAGAPALVCVSASSGYWTKTPFGTRNVPRQGETQVLQSWLSLESVKFMAAWSPALARPLTAGLELSPLEDPFAAREGDKLTLLVTLEGRPVEGAIVTYDGKARGRTGEAGTLNIRLRHAAFQSIAANLTLPLGTPEAEQVIHAAHLNFETQVE